MFTVTQKRNYIVINIDIPDEKKPVSVKYRITVVASTNSNDELIINRIDDGDFNNSLGVRPAYSNEIIVTSVSN